MKLFVIATNQNNMTYKERAALKLSWTLFGRHTRFPLQVLPHQSVWSGLSTTIVAAMHTLNDRFTPHRNFSLVLETSVVFLLLFSFLSGHAQSYTQTIRGTVIEKQLQRPLIGATVQVLGLSLGDKTDEFGNFIITQVPVGTQTVMVSSIGFKENTVSNLVVNSGKEVVLTIAMEEKIHSAKEVVIK